MQVITQFLGLSYQKIYKILKNLGKKLDNLYLDNSYHNSVTFHNPDRVIFNSSDHVLNTTEKYLPSKGLNFVKPPKNISCYDFMLPIELFTYGCRLFESF